MIASLKGIVSYKTPELRKDCYVVLDVNGVGYKVFTPASNIKRLNEGEEAILFTYMSVSERALDLFGFLDPADKTFFSLLLEVPGVGPKSALQILNKTTMLDVQQAVLENNSASLVALSGLGQKTADKIIVTLKSKVAHLSVSQTDKKSNTLTATDDVIDALASFGYSGAEIKKALSSIDSSITDTSERIREALKSLAK
jgi:Holliday junction DNA helicase RuvA